MKEVFSMIVKLDDTYKALTKIPLGNDKTFPQGCGVCYDFKSSELRATDKTIWASKKIEPLITLSADAELLRKYPGGILLPDFKSISPDYKGSVEVTLISDNSKGYFWKIEGKREIPITSRYPEKPAVLNFPFNPDGKVDLSADKNFWKAVKKPTNGKEIKVDDRLIMVTNPITGIFGLTEFHQYLNSTEFGEEIAFLPFKSEANDVSVRRDTVFRSSFAKLERLWNGEMQRCSRELKAIYITKLGSDVFDELYVATGSFEKV